MVIYNKKQDLWLMAWDLYDPEALYVKDYQKRPETYFDDRVTKARKNLVISRCDIKTSFDYGCGMQPFHYNIETGESSCLGLWDKYVPEFKEFNSEAFFNSKTLLLFDVLEHIYDPHSFLLTLPQKRLILTLPVFPEKINSLEQLKGWRHYKPGEHTLYTTEDGIIDIVTESGWNVEYKGYDECPPRLDILSLVLTRK